MKKIIWIIAGVAVVGMMMFKLLSNKKTTENRVYQYDKEKPILVSVDTIRLQNFVDAGNYTGTFEPNKETKISADIQGKINQKKLEITNNELQSKLITEKNDMEVENAIRQKTIAQSTITNTESQIALAKTIYEQTVLQQKQKHGTASLTDVLLADNALREAQQNYLNAVIDFLKADLELKKLTGSIKN